MFWTVFTQGHSLGVKRSTVSSFAPDTFVRFSRVAVDILARRRWRDFRRRLARNRDANEQGFWSNDVLCIKCDLTRKYTVSSS